MNSVLEQVLAGIIMVELETEMISRLGDAIFYQKEFVDRMVGYFKVGINDVVLAKLKMAVTEIKNTCGKIYLYYFC